MAEDFIQSPPDSTGKRVHSKMVNDGANDIYTPVYMLSDRNTPSQRQAVNNKGAARIEFEGGSTEFDAFGRTTVSEPNLVGMYKFYQRSHNAEFNSEIVGGATITRDVALQCMKLTCGTASGDRAAYNSHRFYQYRPANTLTLTMTVNAGDTGKAGVKRCFGWITPDNGLFFEWSGTTFNVVIRDGNLATEQRIEQTNWNVDNLSGADDDNNLSGATLDISKDNIWWIDFQFLGAGAVRFGTWVDGKKVTCHTIGHYNALDRPYLSSPTMSFGVEQENLTAVGSSSEFHVFCTALTNDGYDEFDIHPISFGTEKALTTTSFVPLISFKPTEVLSETGDDNRNRILPRLISALAIGGDIELIAEVSPVLTGATWAVTKENILIDNAATAAAPIAGTTEIVGQVVASGRNETIDLSSVFLLHKDGITRDFNIANSGHVTISGRLLAAGSATAVMRINAVEVM